MNTTEKVALALRHAETLGVNSGFVELFESRALAEARLSDIRPSHARRSLEGTLIAWKDLFAIQGHANRAGLDRPVVPKSSRDASLVRQATRAGAITLGVTALTEIAYSLLGENIAEGTRPNPMYPDELRLAGGSSTGSAIAVAQNIVPVAFGTDSGGSSRLPAAWCGLVGFKPSRRELSLEGCLPYSPSFDSAGIITNCVAITRAVFNALRQGARADVRRLSFVTIDLSLLPDLSPLVAQGYSAALDVIAHRHPVERIELAALEAAISGTAADLIPIAEGTAIWAHFRQTARTDSYAALKEALEEDFRRTDGLDLAHAHWMRDGLVSSFAREMRGRVLVLPACAADPPTIEQARDKTTYQEVYAGACRYLRPFNVLDAPSICLPVTRHAGSVGSVQLVAGRGEDDLLLAAAADVAGPLSTPERIVNEP